LIHGQGTWYIPGLGACGSYNTRADYVVAINQAQYHSKMCHKHDRIINMKNGKSVHAETADECPTCSFGSLDMSPVVFSAIAESGLDEGRLEISWSFS
ncbi:RlpA-like double-psi beta-barrel-protein domain-containing protein-containing protein, partial [Gautieria morchelliformis]